MKAKQFKKVLALVLALVMCLGVLTACGGGGGTGSTPPANDQQQPSGGGNDAPPPSVEPVDPSTLSGFNEAPFIASMGITTPVEDRLPVKDDILVETVMANGQPLSIGTYGGELKRSASTSVWTCGKPIEEGLFLFNSNAEVVPNVAKSWEISSDSTTYTIHLREGLKWSDGEPFTAEDCVWFYNTICLNNLDTKGVRNCHKDANGDPAVVEKVDDYTFTVKFGTPKYDFLETCEVDLKWHWSPKHVLENVANLMVEGKNDEALAEGKNITGMQFADVTALGKAIFYNFWCYPNIPTVNSFVISTESGKNDINGDYYEFIRNPYYWKVDAAGNQLPYIDKIIYTTVQNVSQDLMLLLDGTVDFMTVAMESIPTILESQTKININEWSGVDWGSAPHQLHINLNIADPQKHELYNNIDFRHGLSICVNRDEFAALASDGWQEGGQSAPQPGTQGYSEEWAKKWTEYDVAEAQRLFESAGLVKGADGFYTFADGSKFEFNIIAMADQGAAETYKILEPYFRAAGIKCTFRDYDRSYVDNEILSGGLEAILYPVTPIGDISIALKPNSMVPGAANNVAWYTTMTYDTASPELKQLMDLKSDLDKTADPDKRAEIAAKMLKLHEDNMWTLNYVAAAPVYHAVNARIQNFPDGLVWSDIYRDMGIAHAWCWYIQE